jgi:hypothetical protein
MKSAAIFVLACALGAFAQDGPNIMFKMAGPMGPMEFGEKGPAPIKGAPYSATTTSESTQTLPDGNRIVQTTTGSVARDSQGRTRQDTTLPNIGGLSAAKAPHLVFIHDPVAGVSYTLNLSDKTAWKNPVLMADTEMDATAPAVETETRTIVVDRKARVTADTPAPPSSIDVVKHIGPPETSEAVKESLGTQTMEGVTVSGVRLTRTIAAGEIGNERELNIVTEVWTSTDLNAIISSKRNDPRSGEQTFHLTNLSRSEPDAALFTVPADFKMIEGSSKTIIYRRHQ